MRTNLKVFRVKHHMTQVEMAAAIGCSMQIYSAVEAGRREGRHSFWDALKRTFNLDAATVWDLMKVD